MLHAAVEIHPSAHVAADADLGPGVKVGPGAIIEPGARIGEGTVIHGNAVVTGFATLGRNCKIHYGAVVGGDPQDLAFEGFDTRVEIADDVVIREHATVHRATKPGAATVIGRGSYLMVNSHVAHDCVLGERVVVCNSALVAGHSHIGNRAFLSGNTVVHQFSRVGTLVMLSGISGIGRDVGPYLLVAERSDVRGINMVGLRRAGLGGDARRRIQNAYRLLFGAPTIREGVDQVRGLGAEHPEIAEIVNFYGESKRGYSRPPNGHALGEGAED